MLYKAQHILPLPISLMWMDPWHPHTSACLHFQSRVQRIVTTHTRHYSRQEVQRHGQSACISCIRSFTQFETTCDSPCAFRSTMVINYKALMLIALLYGASVAAMEDDTSRAWSQSGWSGWRDSGSQWEEHGWEGSDWKSNSWTDPKGLSGNGWAQTKRPS